MENAVTVGAENLEQVDVAIKREFSQQWAIECGEEMRRMYGRRSKEGADGLKDYHGLGGVHMNKVRRTTQWILEACGATAVERIIGDMAAAGHDLVLDSKTPGENEKASSLKLAEYMREVNEKEGRTLFSDSEISQAAEAIEATAAHVDAGKIVQPNLKAESSLVAKAVAMADILEAGRNPQGFIDDGRALFREINPVLRLQIAKGKEPEDTGQRITKWLELQVEIAESRKDRFCSEEVMWLPETGREKILAGVRRNFEKSIRLADEQVEKAKKMSTEQLIDMMGFDWEKAGMPRPEEVGVAALRQMLPADGSVIAIEASRKLNAQVERAIDWQLGEHGDLKPREALKVEWTMMAIR
jgi:hypothetical protein